MSISVDIVTPEKPLLSVSADLLVVPAADGEMGILARHIPVLAQLQPGEIRLVSGESVQRVAVSGGFVEVEADRVTVFAETAEMAQEIDIERARQAAERARMALRAVPPDRDMAALEAALRRALARLRVAEALRRSYSGQY
ncbi:MAG TPA: F0F1 ATP synthase subunit epsilon [Elusimicrobiota bacterium]|nr:F0F1 ATP synthase subunit epsilon [Elusimicrobiota bacterium]